MAARNKSKHERGPELQDKWKPIDHSGSSFDEFLREDGVLEEAEAVAIKRVIAWQLQREMQR